MKKEQLAFNFWYSALWYKKYVTSFFKNILAFLVQKLWPKKLNLG